MHLPKSLLISGLFAGWLAAAATPAFAAEPAAAISAGDTAWMLTCTGLVLLMTPGLACFYGGLVRRKNVLGTMMQSFAAMAIRSKQRRAPRF